MQLQNVVHKAPVLQGHLQRSHFMEDVEKDETDQQGEAVVNNHLRDASYCFYQLFVLFFFINILLILN